MHILKKWSINDQFKKLAGLNNPEESKLPSASYPIPNLKEIPHEKNSHLIIFGPLVLGALNLACRELVIYRKRVM